VVPDSLTPNFEGDRFSIQRFFYPVSRFFESAALLEVLG
jgi:hypothetical protein